MDDAAIEEIVTRLARPHRSGGTVIERVAILAEGADFDAVMRWILDRDGVAEAAASTPPQRGIHAMRYHDTEGDAPAAPARFILPPGALG
jgi:hypothetical protein